MMDELIAKVAELRRMMDQPITPLPYFVSVGADGLFELCYGGEGQPDDTYDLIDSYRENDYRYLAAAANLAPLLADEVERQAKEIERLKRGDFTPEEFQNLCHNLPEHCTHEVFDAGCRQYQSKLFGKERP